MDASTIRLGDYVQFLDRNYIGEAVIKRGRVINLVDGPHNYTGCFTVDVRGEGAAAVHATQILSLAAPHAPTARDEGTDGTVRQ